MTLPPRSPRPGSLRWMTETPAPRAYLTIGLVSLFIQFLLLSDRAGQTGSLLLLAIGVPGLLAGWVVSPGLYVLLECYLLLDPDFSRLTSGYYAGLNPPREGLFRLEDLLLAGTFLSYLISHFRLQSLGARAFPRDARILRKGETDADPLRPPAAVGNGEIPEVLIYSAVGMVAGAILWWLLIVGERTIGIARSIQVSPVMGRLILLGFTLGFILTVGSVASSYVRWRRMSREEAEMILQDEIWSETRREHERILHWERWRAPRPKRMKKDRKDRGR